MELTFEEDLRKGKSIEHEVRDWLARSYPSAYVTKGYCKEWDIVIPEKDKTVEVKCDEKSHETGNFLIEIEFNGEPSALSTTKADVWIHVDRDYYYVVNTEILRYLVEREWDYTPARFVGSGDKWEKRAYLIPVEEFIYSPYIRRIRRPTF